MGSQMTYAEAREQACDKAVEHLKSLGFEEGRLGMMSAIDAVALMGLSITISDQILGKDQEGVALSTEGTQQYTQLAIDVAEHVKSFVGWSAVDFDKVGKG